MAKKTKKLWKAYKVKIFCCNCGISIQAYIPKGTTVEAYFNMEVCKNCGCMVR